MTDKNFILDVRKRLSFGGMPPLTIDEQKRLCEIAGGVKFEDRQRCLECNATGVVRVGRSWLRQRIRVQCGRCEGNGYV